MNCSFFTSKQNCDHPNMHNQILHSLSLHRRERKRGVGGGKGAWGALADTMQ